MFSTIDTSLILKAQWSVRQIELFTKITLNTILYFLLVTCLVLTVIDSIVATLAIILLASGGLEITSFLWLVIIFCFFMAASHFESIFKINKKRKMKIDSALLPKEILERKIIRTSLLFAFFLVSTCFALVVLIKSSVPFDLSAIIGLFFFYESNFIVELLSEYILCATSLPPGEKERRKQEKEMRNMVPQRISG